jgi:DNA topoisomerase-1
LKNGQINKEEKVENTGAEKSKLFPTDIGIVVNDFLVDQFPNILDYGFTAKVEGEFDDIAEGKLQWQEMMKRFYTPFHTNVADTMLQAQRATGERELGVDPVSGKPVIARIGRFGPIVQIGSSEDEEKKFASLRPDQSIGNITLEQALMLFNLPRNLGEYEGKPIIVNVGRFGPYAKHGNTFASLKVKEGDDPYTIEFDRAVQLVKDKIESVLAAQILLFEERPDVQVLNGRFGPYIKVGKDNFKIPKGKDPKTLTLAEIDTIVAENPPKPARGRGGKAASKAPAKKAPAKKAAAKKAPAKKAAAKKK